MLIHMKILRLISVSMAVLALAPAYSQEQDSKQPKEASVAPKLTKFDLDFPGGTPGALVDAIQKAMGRPLNAFIPAQYADLAIPPLKMKGVDANQLFTAIMFGSQETVPSPYGGLLNKAYGFRTQGAPTDDSVWYFFNQGGTPSPPPPSRDCKYYLLTPYLNDGLTVDDITTAIQTGWKMLGNSTTASLSYHKETKLLIAVADRDHLRVIDSALGALEAPKAKSTATPQVPTAPTDAQKPEK